MPGMTMVRFDLHTALTAWQWSPFSLLVLAGVVAAAYWYLRAEWRLAARGRRWPTRRRLAFLGGLLAIDIALQSPLARFTGDYFQAHVYQHLMLMVVAPPLLAMGAPSTLLLQTSGRSVKTRWLHVLRSRPFAVLTHPITVGCMYFGTMFVFFLTPLINDAMTHMALMDVVNVFFLFGSCCYWWPLVGLDPIVHWKMGHGTRMATVLIGGPIETVLGLAIMSQHTPIASMYTVASTQSGGGLLWGLTDIATLIAFIPMFVQWMHSEERHNVRDDARRDREAEAMAGAALAAAAVTDAGAEADGSRAPVGAPAGSGRQQPAVLPDRPLTAWEAEWLARTGSIPPRAVAD